MYPKGKTFGNAGINYGIGRKLEIQVLLEIKKGGSVTRPFNLDSTVNTNYGNKVASPKLGSSVSLSRSILSKDKMPGWSLRTPNWK